MVLDVVNILGSQAGSITERLSNARSDVNVSSSKQGLGSHKNIFIPHDLINVSGDANAKSDRHSAAQTTYTPPQELILSDDVFKDVGVADLISPAEESIFEKTLSQILASSEFRARIAVLVKKFEFLDQVMNIDGVEEV